MAEDCMKTRIEALVMGSNLLAQMKKKQCHHKPRRGTHIK
jgi:hypothetical protein